MKSEPSFVLGMDGKTQNPRRRFYKIKQDWRSMKAYGARSSVLWCGNYDWFLKHWNTFHPDLENLNGQNTQRHLAACIWKMRGFHWIRSRSGTWNFRKGSTSAHMRRVLVRHQQFHYQGSRMYISVGSNN